MRVCSVVVISRYVSLANASIFAFRDCSLSRRWFPSVPTCPVCTAVVDEVASLAVVAVASLVVVATVVVTAVAVAVVSRPTRHLAVESCPGLILVLN